MILNRGYAIAGLKIASLLNTSHRFAVFLRDCKTSHITELQAETHYTRNLRHSAVCFSVSIAPSDFGTQSLFSSIIYMHEHLRGAGARIGHGLDHGWDLTSQLPKSGPKAGSGFTTHSGRSEMLTLPSSRKEVENTLISSTSTEFI